MTRVRVVVWGSRKADASTTRAACKQRAELTASHLVEHELVAVARQRQQVEVHLVVRREDAEDRCRDEQQVVQRVRALEVKEGKERLDRHHAGRREARELDGHAVGADDADRERPGDAHPKRHVTFIRVQLVLQRPQRLVRHEDPRARRRRRFACWLLGRCGGHGSSTRGGRCGCLRRCDSLLLSRLLVGCRRARRAGTTRCRFTCTVTGSCLFSGSTSCLPLLALALGATPARRRDCRRLRSRRCTALAARRSQRVSRGTAASRATGLAGRRRISSRRISSGCICYRSGINSSLLICYRACVICRRHSSGGRARLRQEAYAGAVLVLRVHVRVPPPPPH